MLRSRATRLPAGVAAVFLLVLIPVIVWSVRSAGGDNRRPHAAHGAAAHPPADAAAGGAGLKPGHRRLTDDEVIERVRRITPWITQGHTHRKIVALTFDDGPGPLTPALMAELRRLHVPATFFQVAQAVDARPDVARQEHRPPFAAGSHTASHAMLTTIGPAGQRREITRGAKVVDQNSGSYPRMFRPPYGYWNNQTIKELKRHRMLMVLWSVTSRDWMAPGEPAIVRNVIHGVRPGAIVLLHDFGGFTREPTLHAVPRIVRALRRKGYRFVTVPEMMREAPPRRRPPRPAAPYPA